jgi:transglutaminase-like putative cysteine protease
MKYRVTHRTEYVYSGTITQCHNIAHLRPRELPGQQCLTHRLEIDPEPVDRAEYEDFFGNRVNYFSIQQPHQQLTVVAVSEIQLDTQTEQLPLYNGLAWDEARARLANPVEAELRENRHYALDSPLAGGSPELADYAAPSFPPGRPLVEAVHDLMQRVHTEFAYHPGYTSVSTPLSEVLDSRRGVCQDFAHLAIACLRSLGLAARYVSGYLETIPSPGKEKLRGADDSHAWFSVFLPEAGWMDFDPTNNQIPQYQHITTAWGRDFGDVTPLKGVVYGGDPAHRLQVAVDVERLDAAVADAKAQEETNSPGP